MSDYIALAIPVFFLLIGVELVVAAVQKKRVYRLNDALQDLSTGVLQQVGGVFTKTVVFGSYVALWQAWHAWEMDASSPLVWIACLLLVDHQYYWFHRVSHEVNLPWGAHIVHHSSEEYNLAVALRQGAFQPLFSFVFYLPLALLGFPPLVFLASSSANTLYQFWIHTRTIGRLGPLEWFLNTPSHHRVHHGCDPKYIDRNYAGILIVWDRLYGTFQVEEEEPTYGITKPLASWNPLWANVHYYADLIRLGRRAPSRREAWRLWWVGPADKPEWARDGLGDADRPTPLTHGEAGKYDSRADRAMVPYVVASYVGVLAATVGLLFGQEHLPTAAKWGAALWIAWGVLDVGAFFEARKWVVPAEVARLAVPIALGGWWLAQGQAVPGLVAAGAGTALLVWLALARTASGRTITPAAA